jgi:hypothetical protein
MKMGGKAKSWRRKREISVEMAAAAKNERHHHQRKRLERKVKNVFGEMAWRRNVAWRGVSWLK